MGKDAEGPKGMSRLKDALSSLFAVLLLLASVFSPPKRAVGVPPPVPAGSLLAELTALSQKIAAHTLRLQIGEVVTQARMLLNSLQTHPDTGARGQDLVQSCLVSTVTGVQRFADRSGHRTDPTDPALIQFGKFLTAITRTLTGVSEILVGNDTAGLGSQIDTYRDALRDINRVYLGAE